MTMKELHPTAGKTAQPKLTATQKEVMKWLGKKWTARVSHGTVVEINGKKACTTATMDALKRHGLVVRAVDGYWSATDAGIKMANEMGL